MEHEKLGPAKSETKSKLIKDVFEIVLPIFVEHIRFSLSFAKLHFPFTCN